MTKGQYSMSSQDSGTTTLIQVKFICGEIAKKNLNLKRVEQHLLSWLQLSIQDIFHVFRLILPFKFTAIIIQFPRLSATKIVFWDFLNPGGI